MHYVCCIIYRPSISVSQRQILGREIGVSQNSTARVQSERDVTTIIISDNAVSDADGKQWRSRQT